MNMMPSPPENTFFNPDPSQPMVSIIMPAYNAGVYITESIQSIQAQTYKNWELIVVDDASTDNTQQIVGSLLGDSRIRYRQVNRVGSPSGVRNAGLKMARGEYIAFLDADDLYFPDTLEKLSLPLRTQPRMKAVYGFAFNIDETGQPLPQTIALYERTPDDLSTSNTPAGGSLLPVPPYQLPPDYNHSWENIATSKITCLLPALMLRRSAWEQIGNFNENLVGAEDYEFYVRMYLNDYEGVHCLSDYVYQYRIHASSLTKAPEHCQRLLDSGLRIMYWLFNEAPVPVHVKTYRSLAYVACYRYLARERLLHKQPALSRQLVMQAFRDRNIEFKDFLKHCAPLLLRSFLPIEVDQWLVKAKSDTRRRQHLKTLVSSNEWVTST